MGLYDRDYTQSDFQSQYRHAPQMRMSFPKITPVVKWLLIINVVVYFMQILGGNALLTMWCSIYPASWLTTLQVWRLVTYQFLHGDMLHILFNMIGLFFLGPTLERHWGSKKFLIFYLGCGTAGGVFYTLLVVLGVLVAGPMVGASGAILGMLAACAILFPQFIVFIVVFPVPIRVAAIGFAGLYVINLLAKGTNAGGDAAHLAGMAVGAIYVLSEKWRRKFKMKVQTGVWKKKMAEHRELQLELDRILKKVHDHGLHSLTYKEKKILRQATKSEQMRNK